MTRFLFLATLMFQAVPAGLEAQSSVWDAKDPDLARRYASFFPGGGHLYTGESLKGGIMAGLSVFSGIKLLGSLGCSAAERVVFDDIEGCSRSKTFLWLAGLAGPWVYGMLDARKSAERVNAQRGFSAFIAPGMHGSMRIGLTLPISSGVDR